MKMNSVNMGILESLPRYVVNGTTKIVRAGRVALVAIDVNSEFFHLEPTGMPFYTNKGVLNTSALDDSGRAGGYLVIDESTGYVSHVDVREFLANYGPHITAAKKPAPVIQSLDRLQDRMDDAATDNANQMRDIAEDALRALQFAEGKITNLEKWQEEYQGKLNAEHVRVGNQYPKSLEDHAERIEALEAACMLLEKANPALQVWKSDLERKNNDLQTAGGQAARDVIAERLRQVTEEGWTPQHDDQHSSGELAGAAACYAQHANARGWIYKEAHPGDYQEEDVPNNWPWDPSWWKPVSPRRDLVRAGALILAEIDRLDRAEQAKEK